MLSYNFSLYFFCAWCSMARLLLKSDIWLLPWTYEPIAYRNSNTIANQWGLFLGYINFGLFLVSFFSPFFWTGRQTQVFHLLVYFLNPCNSPGWARPRPGDENSIRSSTWVAGTITCCLPWCAFAGMLNQKWDSQTLWYGIQATLLWHVPASSLCLANNLYSIQS